MSLPILTRIGLTQKESEIYELLLQKGEMIGGDIIAITGLKRATVYKSLYSLEEKGLVTTQDIHKKIHFKPEPPDKLLALAEQQIRAQERAKGDIQTIMPDLMSSFVLAVEKPVVSTFEGIKGIKEIYEDTLRIGKPVYAVLTTAEVEPHLFKWLTSVYTKKRAKAGIHAHVIASTGSWAREYAKKDEKEARSTVIVPSSVFPFTHEVDIYGDKVAFINFKKGDALIGVVINHPQIAQTMKAWFDLAWYGATRYNTPLAEGTTGE